MHADSLVTGGTRTWGPYLTLQYIAKGQTPTAYPKNKQIQEIACHPPAVACALVDVNTVLMFYNK